MSKQIQNRNRGLNKKMKYVFFKNYSLLKRHILKYYLLLLLVIVIFIIIDKGILSYDKIINFKTYLGHIKVSDLAPTKISLKLLEISIVIFTTFKIFLLDIFNGSEYIILRIKSKKFMFYNMLSVYVYIIFERILIIILTMTLFKIYGINLTGDFNKLLLTIISDLLIYSSISLITIFYINSSCKNTLLSIIPILFLLLSLSFDFNVIFLLLINLLLAIICFKTFNVHKIYEFYHNKY